MGFDTACEARLSYAFYDSGSKGSSSVESGGWGVGGPSGKECEAVTVAGLSVLGGCGATQCKRDEKEGTLPEQSAASHG